MCIICEYWASNQNIYIAGSRISLARRSFRVSLVIVEFLLMPEQLAIINEMGEKIMEPGSFIVYVGGKQPNMKGTADNPTTQVLNTEIVYTGPEKKLK